MIFTNKEHQKQIVPVIYIMVSWAFPPVNTLHELIFTNTNDAPVIRPANIMVSVAFANLSDYVTCY